LSASGSGYYESVKPRGDNGKGPKEDSIAINMYSMPNNDDTEKYYTHDAPKIPLASTEVEAKGYESLGVVKPEDRLI
jgi:hypothetical protein